MAGLMDVVGTVYTSQGPYLNWYTEEISRLEEMADMEELCGPASKMGAGGGGYRFWPGSR